MPIHEYLDTDGTTKDFLFNVQAGFLEGFQQVRKYGINISVSTTTDPEDIWDGGGNYIYDSTNVEMFVYSDDASDNVQVAIEGLIEEDDKWNIKKEIYTTNGQTPVSIGDFIRVYRARIVSSNSPTGNILITKGNTAGISPSNDFLRAKVVQGRNTTLMSMYTVPSDHVAFAYRIFASVGKGKDAEVSWDIRPYGQSFFSETIVGVYQESEQFELGFERAEERTDIKTSCRTEDNGTEVRASFHIVLVHKNALIGDFGRI